jgi:hypothetical protein
MKKRQIALISLVFIIGGVAGFLIAGNPSYAQHIQSPGIRAMPAKDMANVVLGSVAVDVRIASKLQSGEMTREKASKDLEQSSATLLMQVWLLHAPVKKLDFNAQQGVCAAYVYFTQKGYPPIHSKLMRGALKGYLDKSGPEAIRELRKVRSDLGQNPFKPDYAKKHHLNPRANPNAKSPSAPIDVNNMSLADCYKSPTE